MATSRKTAPRKAPLVRLQREAEGLLAGYSKTPKPLGGYAALVALFTVGLAAAFAATKESEEELPKLGWSDLLLFGIATHKLSRVATKDLVTSPFRAPFVKFKKCAAPVKWMKKRAAIACRKQSVTLSRVHIVSRRGSPRRWSSLRPMRRAQLA